MIVLSLCECTAKKDEKPVVPPLTSPLSGDFIGFGVVTDSFTHIIAEPDKDSASLGYLRRGSVVKVIKRQSVRTGNIFVSWVLIDANQNTDDDSLRGWLKEEVMEIYSSEGQAKTAARNFL